jgi:transcriptional regulator with XRE-family HTH domain
LEGSALVTGPDPQFLRGQLGRRLRQLRERRHLTQKRVIETLEWGISKLNRIENGNVTISITDLRSLLALYEVHDAYTVGELVRRARQSREQPWYHEYVSVLNEAFRQLLAYESDASRIFQLHPTLIPGLLQTQGYARAVLQATSSSSDLDMMLKARSLRLQHVMAGPPELMFLIDEAAIRRLIGGEEVMAEQLRALLTAAENPRVTIQIIPYEAGMHVGLVEPFLILHLADDLGTGVDRVVFLENAGSDYLIDDPDKGIAGYKQRWEVTRKQALSTADSVELIRTQADRLASH